MLTFKWLCHRQRLLLTQSSARGLLLLAKTSAPGQTFLRHWVEVTWVFLETAWCTPRSHSRSWCILSFTLWWCCLTKNSTKIRLWFSPDYTFRGSSGWRCLFRCDCRFNTRSFIRTSCSGRNSSRSKPLSCLLCISLLSVGPNDADEVWAWVDWSLSVLDSFYTGVVGLWLIILLRQCQILEVRSRILASTWLLLHLVRLVDLSFFMIDRCFRRWLVYFFDWHYAH